MLLTVLTLLVTALPEAQQTDTVIPVRAGTRLEVENYGGETTVRTWDKPAIRIVADNGARERLEIHSLGTLLSVKAQGRYGPPRSLNLEIAVPLHTELSLSGVNTDVTVDGVQGGISVETVNGQVDVKGGDGFVSLKSVEGEVSLENARGRISVSSVNEGVRVKNANGDISAESVNGEVRLEEITSASVDATTVNGDVIYDGAIQDGGRYSLNTHNGDVTVGVGEKVNATVMVSTFSGEFEASFPVQLTETRRNRFRFVLGSGAAQLTLKSFQGTIRLVRPGERPSKGRFRVKHKDKDNRDRD